MAINEMQDFTFKHSDQLDAIYTQYTAQQIKDLFDSRGVQLRVALNLLITTLKSTEGATDIGTSTIQDIDGVNIQAMLQSIRDKLKSVVDGSSGADYVNATSITDLSGTTVQALLEALKLYIDNHKTSSDHDYKYYTKTELQSITSGSSGAGLIKATPIASGSGDTVQAQLAWLLSQIAIAATGSLPDGSITEVKLTQSLINKINTALSNTGVLSTLLTNDKLSLVNALNEHLADYMYQLAGGTATAITLTGVVLENGHPKTFIASVDNNGADTTINTKHFYKPGTTNSPTLKAGKAYTFWYSLASDCFFIKASAEGNTIASHVLANETFSNDTDTGIKGTAPLKSGITYTPTTSDQIITTGFEDGTCKVKGDVNLASENILVGKSIFGVSGNVQQKLNFDTFLQNLPSGYEPVNFDEYTNLMWSRKLTADGKAYGFNSSGTLISTITCASDSSNGKLLTVSKNYIGWGTESSTGIYITNKNGISIITLSNGIQYETCAINSDSQIVFMSFFDGSNEYITAYNFSGTRLGMSNLAYQSYAIQGLLITKNGCYIVIGSSINIQNLYFMNNSGSLVNLNGNGYMGGTNLLRLFVNIFN